MMKEGQPMQEAHRHENQIMAGQIFILANQNFFSHYHLFTQYLKITAINKKNR